MNSDSNEADQLTLDYEQEGERGIQTPYAISVCRGKTRMRVTQAMAGNFDCTPYESDQLSWGFAAELHRYANHVWVRVLDQSTVTRVEQGDWVTRITVVERLFVEGLTESSWRQVHTDQDDEEVELLEAVTKLGDATLLQRVEHRWEQEE